MKRTLSLVLALVMVLGTFTGVLAEDVSAEVEAGLLLEELGVLEGSDEEGLMLGNALRRRDAVIMLSRLMGEEEIAKEFPGSEELDYEDLENADPFYLPFFAWGKANGTFKGHAGYEGVRFGYDENMTTQQYLNVVLRVLGYEVDYADVMDKAVELGLVEEALENDADLTRGTMALMSVAALNTEIKDTDMTLAEKLEIEMPSEEPAALEVEEVVADNLKSFTVVFNQAVESADVEVEDHAVKFELAEDKMSVVGYFETELDQSDAVTFTITAETEEGLEVEEEVEVVVTDTTVPAALSAKALNPKQIEILFSEPVQLDVPNAKLIKDIKVDDKAVVAEASVNYTNNKVVLTLLAPMAEGTRTLEIAKVKDFANFVAPAAEFDITVVKDEDAPVAISAEVKNNKEIIVTFNEPLSKAAIGTYTVDGKSNVTPEFVDGTNYTQVRIKLTDELSIGAVVEVRVGYKGQRDIMGNEVKTTTYITTSVSDDTSLPTVLSTVVEKGNKVVVTFSKAMSQEGKFEVLNKDGKVIQAKKNIPTLKDKTNKTVLEFTAAVLGLEGINPGQYSIKLYDMKDASIRTNPLGTETLTFTSKDTKSPTVDDHYNFVASTKDADSDGFYENTITIYFSESMDKDSIENLANYMLVDAGNNPIAPLHVKSEYTKATAAGDLNSVDITYKVKNNKDDPQVRILVLSAVKDEAENSLAGVDADRVVTHITEAAKALTIVGDAKLTALNKIEVTFTTTVKTVYPSLFSIEGDDNNYFTSASVDDKTVTFTTARDLKADKTYKLKVVDKELIANKFDKNLTNANGEEVDVLDKVEPIIAEVEKHDTNAIKFTFSEHVTIPTKVNLNLITELRVKDGSIIPATVEAVYAEETVSGGVYAKVLIVHLNIDVDGVEVGFPLGSDFIKDINGNKLKLTEWFEVK